MKNNRIVAATAVTLALCTAPVFAQTFEQGSQSNNHGDAQVSRNTFDSGSRQSGGNGGGSHEGGSKLDGSGNGRGGITVAVVPEPETYAMYLAGAALMGLIALRRKARV